MLLLVWDAVVGAKVGGEGAEGVLVMLVGAADRYDGVGGFDGVVDSDAGSGGFVTQGREICSAQTREFNMLEMLEVGGRAYDDTSDAVITALGVVSLLSTTTTDHAHASLHERLEPVFHCNIGCHFLGAIITTAILVFVLLVVVGIAIADRKDTIVTIAIAVFAVIVFIGAVLLTATTEMRSGAFEIAAHVLQGRHELAHFGCCCCGERGLLLVLDWGTQARLAVLVIMFLRR